MEAMKAFCGASKGGRLGRTHRADASKHYSTQYPITTLKNADMRYGR